MRLVALVLVALVPLAACGGDDAHTIERAAGRTADAGAVTESPAPVTVVDAGSDASASAKEESGQATYYDANGTGACGFKASTDFYVVAMNGTDYDAANCGSCIAVTGPKGSVTVRITDKCPGCGAGGLDLSITAFTKIADKSDGRVDVTWHYVDCP